MARLSVRELFPLLNDCRGRFCNQKNFDHANLSRLERAQANMANWQFETYQNWSGLPTCAIDMIAHLAAELRDGNIDEARTMAQSIAHLANYVAENAEHLADLTIADQSSVDAASEIENVQSRYYQYLRQAKAPPLTDKQVMTDIKLMEIICLLIRRLCVSQARPVAYIKRPI